LHGAGLLKGLGARTPRESEYEDEYEAEYEERSASPGAG
jgi:hypothetical protein